MMKKRSLWGASLAQALADAIDPRHEPVIGEVPPVWVGPSPNPDWCVIAGAREPPGHRHVVAVTNGWQVWVQGPQPETFQVDVDEDAAPAALAVAAATERWLRDEPDVASVADLAFRVLTTLLAQYPGREWGVSLSERGGSVVLKAQNERWPVYVGVPGELAELAAKIDALGERIARCEAFVADRAATAAFAAQLARDLGAGWTSKGWSAGIDPEQAPRSSLSFGDGDGAFHVADIAKSAAGFRLVTLAEQLEVAGIDEALLASLRDLRVRSANHVTIERMKDGVRFRLKKAWGAHAAGTVFVCQGERATGREEFAWSFTSGSAEMLLSPDDAADDDVFNALDDFLELV